MQTNPPINIDVSFEMCSYSNPYHIRRLADLISEYITDPMGGSGEPLTKRQQLYLVDGMANHPSSFVLFACAADEIIGLATCFVNFSTFKIRPYINVHDIVVDKRFRGRGVGKKIMNKIIEIAQEKKYCKVNLEVRDDNVVAQNLYKSLGFEDCQPPMWFWTKTID